MSSIQPEEALSNFLSELGFKFISVHFNFSLATSLDFFEEEKTIPLSEDYILSIFIINIDSELIEYNHQLFEKYKNDILKKIISFKLSEVVCLLHPL